MTAPAPGTGALVATGLEPWVEADLPTLPRSEVQRAAVSAADAGANELVAAVAGQRIRLVFLVLVASGGANTVTLLGGVDGAALTAAMDIGNNAQLVLPYNPAGWCQTVPGQALEMDLSDATLVGGVIGYTLAG
jgi:hypothetical protein